MLGDDYLSALRRLAAEGKKFDILFLDPPYNKNFIQETFKSPAINDIIRDNGWIVAEHDIADALPEQAGKLKRVSSRRYGDSVLSFYSAMEGTKDEQETEGNAQ